MTFYDVMKILIIGGSRFLGPELIKQLIKRHHDITVFNRGKIKYEYEDVRFVQGDRNLSFDLKEHFDVVIDTCAYNGLQTKNALDNLSFDFFLHVGTAAVYQKTDIFPLTESHNIGDWPIWGNYNKGKVECELILKQSNIAYASIRPVYILGKNNPFNRELFIYSKIKNRFPIVLPGNGQAIVQFVFLENVASSIVKIVEQKKTGVFNCGGNELITLNELVKEMAKIVNMPVKIINNPNLDDQKFDINEFPFPNEIFFCDNKKMLDLGLIFTPLIDGLRRDYDEYYKRVI